MIRNDTKVILISVHSRISTNRELQVQNSIPLNGYSREKAREMSAMDKKDENFDASGNTFSVSFHARVGSIFMRLLCLPTPDAESG